MAQAMDEIDPSLMHVDDQYFFETAQPVGISQPTPIVIPTFEDPKRIRNRLAQRKFRSNSLDSLLFNDTSKSSSFVEQVYSATYTNVPTHSSAGTNACSLEEMALPFSLNKSINVRATGTSTLPTSQSNTFATDSNSNSRGDDWPQPHHPATLNGESQNKSEAQARPTSGFSVSSKDFESSELASDTQRKASPGPLTLEQRIRHILDATEEMGFDSIDAVATLYYTARFPKHSLLHYAQSTSRSHRLGKFLSSLHESSNHWVGREARGYHDGQISCIERTCTSELGSLLQHIPLAIKQDTKKRTFIVDIISRLLAEESDSLLKRDKQYLKEQVCSPS
ncbi:hypothetical protein MauCBS54593_002867 [Microsporum audouinii]